MALNFNIPWPDKSESAANEVDQNIWSQYLQQLNQAQNSPPIPATPNAPPAPVSAGPIPASNQMPQGQPNNQPNPQAAMMGQPAPQGHPDYFSLPAAQQRQQQTQPLQLNAYSAMPTPQPAPNAPPILPKQSTTNPQQNEIANPPGATPENAMVSTFPPELKDAYIEKNKALEDGHKAWTEMQNSPYNPVNIDKIATQMKLNPYQRVAMQERALPVWTQIVKQASETKTYVQEKEKNFNDLRMFYTQQQNNEAKAAHEAGIADRSKGTGQEVQRTEKGNQIYDNLILSGNISKVPKIRVGNKYMVDNAELNRLGEQGHAGDIVQRIANFKADSGSLAMQTKKSDAIQGVLKSFHNNLGTWDNIAKGIAPKLGGEHMQEFAKQLKAMDFSGVRTADEAILKIKQGFNDPQASALMVAAMSAAMDYARIMQGPQSAASLTENSKAEAMRLIAAAADNKSRNAIMATLESDTEGQVQGALSQIDATKGRFVDSSNIKVFKSKEELQAAIKAGKIKKGDTFNDPDGVSHKVQ